MTTPLGPSINIDENDLLLSFSSGIGQIVVSYLPEERQLLDRIEVYKPLIFSYEAAQLTRAINCITFTYTDIVTERALAAIREGTPPNYDPDIRNEMRKGVQAIKYRAVKQLSSNQEGVRSDRERPTSFCQIEAIARAMQNNHLQDIESFVKKARELYEYTFATLLAFVIGDEALKNRLLAEIATESMYHGILDEAYLIVLKPEVEGRPNLLQQLIRLFIEKGKLAEALSLTSIVLRAPDDANLIRMLFYSLVSAGYSERALNMTNEDVYKKYRDDVQYYCFFDFITRGQTQAALALINEQFGPALHQSVVNLYSLIGNLEKAYEIATKKASSRFQLLFCLRRISIDYIGNNDFNTALRILRDTSLDGEISFTSIFEALVFRGRLAQAQRLSTWFSPTPDKVFETLAKGYIARHDYETALSIANRCRCRNKDILASIEISKGNLAAAEALDSHESWFAICYAYIKNGDYENSIRLINQKIRHSHEEVIKNLINVFASKTIQEVYSNHHDKTQQEVWQIATDKIMEVMAWIEKIEPDPRKDFAKRYLVKTLISRGALERALTFQNTLPPPLRESIELDIANLIALGQYSTAETLAKTGGRVREIDWEIEIIEKLIAEGNYDAANERALQHGFRFNTLSAIHLARNELTDAEKITHLIRDDIFLFKLVKAHIAQGNTDAAMRVANKMNEKAMGLIHVYIAKGQMDHALFLARFYNQLPEYSVSCLSLGKTQEALKILDEAQSETQNNIILSKMVEWYIQAGQIQNVRPLLDQITDHAMKGDLELHFRIKLELHLRQCDSQQFQQRRQEILPLMESRPTQPAQYGSGDFLPSDPIFQQGVAVSQAPLPMPPQPAPVVVEPVRLPVRLFKRIHTSAVSFVKRMAHRVSLLASLIFKATLGRML